MPGQLYKRFSLYYHFSEDPSIICFHPRPHPSHPSLAPVVWAIDQEKSPLYFFPRDCPRIGFGRSAKTTPEDAARFMGYPDASMIIVAESAWYQRSKAVQVYVPSQPLRLLGSWGLLLCLPRDSYASIRGANGRSAGLPDSSKRGASSHSFFEALARFPARFHDAVFHDPSAKCPAVMTGFKNIRKQKTGSPSKWLPVCYYNLIGFLA